MKIEMTTGDLGKWADALEKKGFDLGERLTKKVKRRFEHQRRDRRVRFRRIRRLKSGKRRFIGKRPPIEKAELTPKSFAAHFQDIFDEE